MTTDKQMTWSFRVSASGDLRLQADTDSGRDFQRFGTLLAVATGTIAAHGRFRTGHATGALSAEEVTPDLSQRVSALCAILNQLIEASGPFGPLAEETTPGLPKSGLPKSGLSERLSALRRPAAQLAEPALPRARKVRGWRRAVGLQVLDQPEALTSALAEYRLQSEVPLSQPRGSALLADVVGALGRLVLAGGATVLVSEPEDHTLRLSFHEAGPELSAMCVTGVEGDLTKPDGRVVQRLIAEDAAAPRHRLGLLLGRAMQIAAVLRGYCVGLPDRVEITVTHDAVPEVRIGLAVTGPGWAFALPEQAARLRLAFERRDLSEGVQAFEAAGLEVSQRYGPWEVPADAVDLVARAPRVWQDKALPDRPRWTYSGTGGVPSLPAGAMPFAFEPPRPVALQAARWRDLGVPALGELNETYRTAWLEWLDGPRKPTGVPEVFALRYLEGIEFYLLREAPAASDTPALAREVARLARQASKGSRLAEASLHLWDWLGATGRRKVEHLGTDAPATVLVETGRRAAQDGRLTPQDLGALARHLLPETIPKKAPEPAHLADVIGRLAPQGLAVRLPRVQLRLAYRSLSGACDMSEKFCLPNLEPVRDLRHSTALRRLIAECAAHLTDGRGGNVPS